MIKTILNGINKDKVDIELLENRNVIITTQRNNNLHNRNFVVIRDNELNELIEILKVMRNEQS